jgi:hypothetical protein
MSFSEILTGHFTAMDKNRDCETVAPRAAGTWNNCSVYSRNTKRFQKGSPSVFFSDRYIMSSFHKNSC